MSEKIKRKRIDCSAFTAKIDSLIVRKLMELHNCSLSQAWDIHAKRVSASNLQYELKQAV